MSTTKTLFMAGTAAIALSAIACRPALAIPGCTSNASTCFTTSAAEVDTIIDTPVTQQANTFSTELTAQMQGGPVLYDQTFPVPFADPVFQSAIGTAELVLTGAGAVSFLGPTPVSSTNTLSTTTNTVQTSETSSLLFGEGVWIGPVTLDTGDFGVCQSYTLETSTFNPSTSGSYPLMSGCTIGGTPLTLRFGAVDYDTFDLTLVDIFTTTTTTNTDLLTQDYNLVGVPASVPVPEPPEWFNLTMLLVGASCIIRQKIKNRAHPPSESTAI